MSAILLLTFASCGGNTEPESNSSDDTQPAFSRGPLVDIEDESDSSGTNPPPTSSDTQSTEPKPELVRVTIPEGTTLVKLSWILRDKGICNADDFINTAQKGDFTSFPLVAAAKKQPNVCFPLEGYLFPATYEFYKGESPESIIKKLISATEGRITEQIRQRAAELGYSVHEIITLASIIEKEAQNDDQRANVSSVLHNRLKIGMKLQCDVTINYVEYVIYEVYKNDQNYKYYYNTERCAALPAGPICNPGMASINAALYPAETDYLYFVMGDGRTLYASDYETHQKNCDELGIEPQ